MLYIFLASVRPLGKGWMWEDHSLVGRISWMESWLQYSSLLLFSQKLSHKMVNYKLPAVQWRQLSFCVTIKRSKCKICWDVFFFLIPFSEEPQVETLIAKTGREDPFLNNIPLLEKMWKRFSVSLVINLFVLLLIFLLSNQSHFTVHQNHFNNKMYIISWGTDISVMWNWPYLQKISIFFRKYPWSLISKTSMNSSSIIYGFIIMIKILAVAVQACINFYMLGYLSLLLLGDQVL